MAVSLCLLITDTDPQRNSVYTFIVQIDVCTSSAAKCLRFKYARCDKRHTFRPTVLSSNLHKGVFWWLKFYTLLSWSSQLLWASLPDLHRNFTTGPQWGHPTEGLAFPDPQILLSRQKFLARPLYARRRRHRAAASLAASSIRPSYTRLKLVLNTAHFTLYSFATSHIFITLLFMGMKFGNYFQAASYGS